MFLREISVAVFRPGYDRDFYLRAAEHITEIFTRFLPRKYVLDGTGKIGITLGHTDGRPRYAQLINVSEYYFEDFDFVPYDIASATEKDCMILSAIEKSLLDIASQFKADPQPIREAAEATRRCGFELKGYTKLSRFTKSRKLHLRVFQRLAREGISWGIDISTPKGDILETVWITKKIDAWRSAHAYRKSFWRGDDFVIVDFLGEPTFELGVASLESRLLAGKH